MLLKLRFVVEEIQLGGGAHQMKEDDMLGPGREMGFAGLSEELRREELIHGHGAHPQSGSGKKGAAMQGIHRWMVSWRLRRIAATSNAPSPAGALS